MRWMEYTHKLKDWSVISLIITNLLLLIYFILGNLSVMTVVLIYWIQSVIIGFFNFIRLLTWPIVVGSESSEMTVPKNINKLPFHFMKYLMAFFFAIHFGTFLVNYFVFILASLFFSSVGLPTAITGNVSFLTVLMAGTIFFINHLYSFIHNRKSDLEKAKLQSIGAAMFRPYLRIIPMHIFILLGFFVGQNVFYLFIILKTIIDVAMHIQEHN